MDIEDSDPKYDNSPEAIDRACSPSTRSQTAMWYNIFGAYCPPVDVINEDLNDHPGLDGFKRCIEERGKNPQYIFAAMEQLQAWRLLRLVCSSPIPGFDDLAGKACLGIVANLGPGEHCRWAVTILKQRRRFFLLWYKLQTLKDWLMSDGPTLKNIMNSLIATSIVTKQHNLKGQRRPLRSIIEAFAWLYSHNDPEVMAASTVETLEAALGRQLAVKIKRKRESEDKKFVLTNYAHDEAPANAKKPRILAPETTPLVELIDQRANIFLQGFAGVLERACVPADIRPKLAYALLLNARECAMVRLT